jgi:hypothetical protein
MDIIISEKISKKLSLKHNVMNEEVEQCFANIAGKLLLDPREEHQSDPATHWFIACTNSNRKLKVVFIPKDGKIYIRTAFPPNEAEMRIYAKYGEGN